MKTPDKADQTALLSRLYDLKLKQLLQASKQQDTLLYRVLSAEAQAISDALKSGR
ncbi:MAG: hypothetical protein MI794_08055 [Pseudomonadales bacterium]|uniref:hypothetical protein n=1 Tax=Marinobacter xestospongiae TaxID=994319 RepID=UPI002005CC11|nr:hypothetical protein [Marinobacter xestospongiae]MCG8517930.1 hypothetical protein [Pseudomonadales bacterium]MCK7565385.1 hypothetical protein [Marinobacter xestospongiae]